MQRFSWVLFATCLIGAASVAAFNYVIDPYGVYQVIDVEGLNRVKPTVHVNKASAKINTIRAVRPRGIVLGTSRAELGLDPNHPGWDRDSFPRFNFAFPLSSMKSAEEYFTYANRVQPLKQVVIGLDYGMFQLNRDDQDESYSETLEKYGQVDSSLAARLPYTIYSLLSYDALSASIETILFQHGDTLAAEGSPSEQRLAAIAPQIKYFYNGQRDETPLYQTQRRYGHYVTFNRMLVRMKRQQLLNLRAYAQQPSLEDEVNARYMQAFRSLVVECRRKAIDLRPFVSPIHAEYYALLTEGEGGRSYQAWLSALIAIVDEANRQQPAREPTLLRDFSGYNSYTTERVPRRGDTTTEMKWYWEASHYKEALGDVVLDIVFTDDQVDGFGRIISTLPAPR